MAAFSYIAIDGTGKQQKGVVDADSARQVRQILRDKSLMATDVSPAMNDSDPKKSVSFSFGRHYFTLGDVCEINATFAPGQMPHLLQVE